MENTEAKPDGTLVDTLPIEGLPAEDYVPEGFASAADFLTDMRMEHKADVAFDQENREQAIDDKKFAAGEQWDPQVIREREGLPCLVINNIPQFTAQLVGDWRESRKAIKVVPSNDEDVEIASVRGDLIRSIEMESRANRVYEQSFESVVQCGDGAFRVSVEYARDDVFDQSLFLRPIEDALSVVWDRFSVDPTGRDAKRVFVNDKMPKKEYKQKFGNIPADTIYGHGFNMDDLTSEGWIDQDNYQVTEYWRLIERRRLMGLFQGGHIFIIDDENQDRLVETYGPPIKTRVTWVTYAQMHLCTGFAILSGPYEYMLTRVPILRMSGRVTNIGGRRIRYGIVRFMKDAARLKNFWRSTAAEQLGYAPKAKWMVTESAIEGREDKLRNAHNSRDPVLVFNDEAEFGRNVQRIDPPGIEAALLNESQTNAQDMKDVTGIHDASLGVRSNETSGRAIMARQREGDVANITFHDNGNAAVLEAGDVLNQLIPQVYDGTRVIRTIGEDETPKFIAINVPMDPETIDISSGKFDVALTTGSSYTTRRVEAAQAMMEAIQVWPDLMSVAGDLVAKAQDWPGADKLADRLKKTVPPHLLEEGEEGGLGITAEQLAELQATIQEGQAELQRLQQQVDDKAAEIKIDAYNAQTQRIRALSDHMVDDQDQQRKAIADILEYSAKLDESDRADLVAEMSEQRARRQDSIPQESGTASRGTLSQPSSANG